MSTPIGDLNRLYKQMHEPDEYHLAAYDLNHGLYWIFVLKNSYIKNLPDYLRKYVKEHARFDVFVNGQFIGPNDYIVEQFGPDVLVKFKKANFQYQLESNDMIKISGDIEIKEVPIVANTINSGALRYLINENDTYMLQEDGGKIFLV
jgi:hypothetical protein